ncbi:MAG: 50S ribosomal protein L37ae, partial [Thermoplasmata archaeon]|nr:50S ribosomal protein L37ae [Thermoplasmata archaeon]
MAKGTKKVGMTGKYGPRYGVKIRKQIKSVSRHMAKPQRCPECQADSVKRVASGIWRCRHCNLKFAASAYSVRTRSYKREEAKSQLERFQREDSTDLREELADSGITKKIEEPVIEADESEVMETLDVEEDEEITSEE